MAIFGSTKVTESVLTPDESMNVSQACMTDMLESFSKEIYQLTAATYISDIRMEEAVSEGANVEGVMESVVGDFFQRIIDAFKKLGNKIKGWFKAFRRWLDLIFKHGKAFVTRFRKDIEDKNASGYEYESYKYNQSKGDALAKEKSDALSGKIKGLCEEMSVPEAKESGKWEEKMGAHAKYEDDYKTSKGTENILKETLKYEDRSKMVEAIKKAYRGDAESKTTLKDFEGNSKGEMMKFIEGSKNQIKEVSDAETTFTRDIEEVISALEKSKDKFKDDEAKRGGVGRLITHTTSMLRECVTLTAAINEIRKGMYGEMASAFESTLKGFLRYKPAKTVTDSFVADEETSSMDSLLESSMKLV